MPDDTPGTFFPQRRRPAHLATREADGLSVIQFVTVCTWHRAPILANPEIHQVLRAVWTAADVYLIGRYVLMPDHLHFFCAPGTYPPEPLTRWMRYWKSIAARRASVKDGPIWQRDFWDTQLRRGDSYAEKWNYVRNNPVRAGLAESADEWPYQGEIHSLMWHD